jgi:argininosuccinate lyase
VLPDELSTGSSMLPQKKNPDIAELARAKAGRLIGHVAGILAVLKGLPLAYNRDLQEDKEPLFDAVDTCRLVLPALSALVREVTFDTDRMATAADGGTLGAVDLAEWLVERQMPFRRAHELIGSLVRESLARNVALSELVAARPELGDEAAGLLAPGVGVTRRRSPGGAGPGPVAVQLDRLRGALREARTALEAEEADLDKVSARPEP